MSLVQRVLSGEMSSEAAVSTCLEAVGRHNPALNAVVTLNPQALEQAREADRARLEGRATGALQGVPIVVKDTYRTAGLRTTAGYPGLRGWVPDSDGVAAALLRRAGAIVIGKGNTPTLAMDMQTNNPWDPMRTCGGSTGGDSVAVATGMAALGFGSDLAGSLRIPAAYGGVYSLKTTYGVVSKLGHVPPLPGAIDGLHSLAVLGPVAASVGDLAPALEALTQKDPGDRTVLPLLPSAGPTPLQNLRVAWCDTFGGVPVAKEIRDAVQRFAQTLAGSGAPVVRAEPRDFPYEQAWETWGGLVAHQGGYDVPNAAKALGAFFARASVRGIPHQRRIIEPTSVARYMDLLSLQREHITRMENFLADFDVWICPVSSTTAFPHHQPSRRFGDFSVYDMPLVVDGEPVPYYVATQSLTTLFAVTENPVVTMPIGLDSSGLPMAVQLVGRRFGDWALLQAAEALDPCHDRITL